MKLGSAVKKRILEILPRFHCGGAERFVVDLCNELAASCDVTILCVTKIEEGDFLVKELRPEVKLIRLERRQNFWSDFAAMPAVWRIISQLHPDVVHCHLGGILLAGLAILSHIPRVPYVYTVHNNAFVDAGNRLLIRRILFRFGRVYPVAISEESQESFTQAYGFSAPLIVNGTRDARISPDSLEAVREEVSSWRSSPDSQLLLNIARIVPQKNQLALARAAANVSAEGVQLDVVFIGEAVHPEIRDEIVKLNCPHLHIAGLKKAPLPYLALADALILPSVFEGLPITLLEAFSLGVPACVSPIGGMKDVVRDGVNGLVSAGTSEGDIAELLRRWCALSREKRIEMGRAAQKSYEPYSIEKCAVSYIELMDELK